MFGDVPFMQAVMYIFQSMSILMQSVLLAIVTRIAQFILPDRDASQEFKAMTVTELADELQINRDRIYRYCRQAGITEKHVGEIPMLLSKKEVAAVRKEFGER